MAEEAQRDRTPASRGGVRFGFAARIGAALAAPRAALAASDHLEDGGKSVTDIAVLFALTVMALHTAEVVTGAWIVGSGEIGGGLGSLVAAVNRGIAGELTFLLILAVAITLFAGKRRSLGRDLDLACTALVPLLFVKMAAALSFTVAGAHPGRGVTDALGILGYGWSSALALLAVRQARSRGAEEATEERPAARRAWRRVGWGALAVWGALIGVHGAAIAQAPERVRPVVSGDMAPAFELPVISDDGEVGPERVALRELKGKVVVLEFWATWCGPCRASLPALQRIREKYEGAPVEVVAVNIEGPRRASGARKMLRELGYEGAAVSDSGRVANQYKVTTIPHLAVVGREGEVELVHRGFPGAEAYERTLRGTIDRLLDR